MTDVQPQDAAASPEWARLPEGEYAIVELFGHTTLVGRIAEVERFGAKMMALEVLFAGKLLEPVYQGGPSIYRLTPCTREVAWDNQPSLWALPSAIKSVVPPALLPAPDIRPGTYSIEVTGVDENGDQVEDGDLTSP